jgi:hypothetical protein
MRRAESLVKTVAHNLTVADDHAADHRVGLDESFALRGQRQRQRHIAIVFVRAACHKMSVRRL